MYQVVEDELQELLVGHSDQWTEECKSAVVRSGYQSDRE